MYTILTEMSDGGRLVTGIYYCAVRGAEKPWDPGSNYRRRCKCRVYRPRLRIYDVTKAVSVLLLLSSLAFTYPSPLPTRARAVNSYKAIVLARHVEHPSQFLRSQCTRYVWNSVYSEYRIRVNKNLTFRVTIDYDSAL